MTIAYPEARTIEQADNYHGTLVRDPYRWLEDPDAPETRAWIEAQNALTFGYVRSVEAREAIQKRITHLWDYEKFGLPRKKGTNYFYSRNDGLQNQAVLYIADSLDAPGRVLLDPNALSEDGTIALSGTSISEDGTLIAYAISHAGSDWQEWKIRVIATGKDLPDLIQWAKFTGISWTKDGKGFYYSRYDEPHAAQTYQQANRFQKIFHHTLGEGQDADVLIYERPDQPEWYLRASITDDGRYLVISASEGTDPRNRLYYKDLAVPDSPVRDLLPEGDADYNLIDNDGTRFYFLTDKDAPRRRVISFDLSAPTDWQEVIGQTSETLNDVSLFGDTFIATYLKDARTEIKVYGLDGAYLKDIELPGIGSAGGFGGRREEDETFYAFSGYTAPTTIYRYDVKTGASSVFRQPRVDFDPDAFVTEQVFYTSKDGTRVPMFVSHKKGLQRDGTNPTYLYAYGGFAIPLTPGFSPTMLTWMEMGGVYVVANLRGGGEYGEDWHQAGMKGRKQNVFDDFIAAAEFLIAEGYTSRPRLAIAGGSNGGLLVGAVVNQRPDLYGAAIPAVGVMDMVRFPKFTVGWGWKPEYGDPENAEDFSAIYAYSPYHNLQAGTRYPAVLVTTSDHDDRVVPAHSFKYTAALQTAQAPDGPPTFIRIETRAGHGAGKPTAKIIEENADVFAFLVKSLKMTLPEGFGE